MASKLYLAQGAVGLFIKELDLVRSRAGLFVREAPGNLERKVGYSSIVFKSGLYNFYPRYEECLHGVRLKTCIYWHGFGCTIPLMSNTWS